MYAVSDRSDYVQMCSSIFEYVERFRIQFFHSEKGTWARVALQITMLLTHTDDHCKATRRTHYRCEILVDGFYAYRLWTYSHALASLPQPLTDKK